MHCEDAQDVIPSFVGGELSDGERVALEAYLAVCSACETEAAELRESRALLYGLADGEPPAGTYVKIWNAVRDEFFPARDGVRPTGRG